MIHTPTRQRAAQTLRGLAALITLAVLLVGLPTGLYTVTGFPIPHTLPTWTDIWARLWQPDTDQTLFLAAVTLIGWAAWAFFAATTLAEAVSLLRGRPLPYLPGPAQHLARNLLATAALAFTTASATTNAASPVGHHQAMPATATPARADQAADGHPVAPPSAAEPLHHPHNGGTPSTASTGAHGPRRHAWRTHVVRRGDTLWAIARHAYGSGTGYPRIYQASKHLHQPHGLPAVRSPHWIYPGQHLHIPTPQDKTPPRPPANPPKRSPVSPTTPPDERPSPSPSASAPTRPANPPPTSRNAPSTPASPPTTSSPRTPRSQPATPTTPPPTHSSPTDSPRRPEQPTPPAPTRTPPTPQPSTPQPSTPAPSSSAPLTSAPHPSASPTAPTSRPPASSPAPTGHGDDAHQSPVTVALRTGGYVGLGLAGAISIVLAATRLHRRHRRPHVEQWPPPAREPEPEPPEPVAQIRKAHLDAMTGLGEPAPADEDLIAADFAKPPPTRIALGTRGDGDDQREVTVELSGLSLALTGPGALDSVRAAFTELLARSRRGRVELVLTDADAALLLDGTGIPPARLAEAVPGLILTPSADAASAYLETEILHRARLLQALDLPDVHHLRKADPGEPLPALVIIAAAPDNTAVLQAILDVARRYCVGGLMIGTWPTAITLHVTNDGTITRTHGPDADAWTGVQLFHLGPAEATGLLQTIRTSHGAPDQPAPPHTPGAPGPGPTTPRPDPTEREADGHGPAPTAPSGGDGRPRQPPTKPTGPARPGTAPPESGGPEPAPGGAAEPRALDSAERPVRIRLLGTMAVDANRQPVATGLRRAAYDLLAYLALNPNGITRDEAIEDLWGDRTPASGGEQWHTAINNLRKTLRTATGLREPMFVIRVSGRYRLDPTLIECDLWHLSDALHAAQHAKDDAERLHALQQIPDLYTGELATDLTHDWAETQREHLRRHGIDALVHLARLTHKTDPDQALAALEQAITHDPYAEPVYQHTMRLQAQLGRTDAARRTYQLLETKLAELDVDPSDETRRILISLTNPRPPRSTTVGSVNE